MRRYDDSVTYELKKYDLGRRHSAPGDARQRRRLGVRCLLSAGLRVGAVGVARRRPEVALVAEDDTMDEIRLCVQFLEHRRRETEAVAVVGGAEIGRASCRERV